VPLNQTMNTERVPDRHRVRSCGPSIIALDPLEFVYVYASVDTDSLRSAAMLTRAGFVYLRKEGYGEGDFHIYVSQ
jgi:hypothetical protein